MDADAEILERPVWLDTVDADIAFHTIQPRGEMLTGTVYFIFIFPYHWFLLQYRILKVMAISAGKK